MSENKNKMIDPADVQELLNKYKLEKRLDSYGMLTGLIHDLRDLLPKPDYPEDMLGMWAEHPVHGRVLVCSAKPNKYKKVGIVIRDDDELTGVAHTWVVYTTLSFLEQHPETLTTLEDYENAPVGTVVAIDGNQAWTKTGPDRWCSPGGVARDADIACGIDKVLRWGWGE